MTAAGRPVLVLDVETRLSRRALALLPDNRGGAGIDRHLLQEVASVSLLGFTMSDAGLVDAWLSSEAHADDERSMIALVEERLAVLGADAILVTHNGVAHDLPLCLRRAMANWFHDCPALQAWNDAGRDRHVDTMLRTARRGSPAGPALTDLCASLGIVATMHPPGRRAIDPLEAKGSFDVARTAVVYLHLEAMRRRDPRWLAACWGDLAAFLLSAAAPGDHLRPLARQGIEVARAAGLR